MRIVTMELFKEWAAPAFMSAGVLILVLVYGVEYLKRDKRSQRDKNLDQIAEAKKPNP
jgi:hypothetical protein